jgi:outer membrane immunogenic protein
MVKFRSALLLAVGAAMQLVPLALSASAAELPSTKDAPYEFVPLWKGFYFGAHGGGTQGNTKLHDQFDYVGDPTVDAASSKIGWLAGGQLGYNIQYNRFVFGLEADAGYLSTKLSKSIDGLAPKDGTCTATYGPGDSQTYIGQMCEVNAKYSTSSDLYGDLTARAGFLLGNTLLYAKGGAAVLNSSLNSSYSGGNCTTDTAPDGQLGTCGWGNWTGPKWDRTWKPTYTTTPGRSIFNFDHSDLLIGWTAGAGVEYKLNTSWSIKAEYQHFDFGKMSVSYKGCYAIPGTPGTCANLDPKYSNHYTSTIEGKSDVSITADAIKLGINYHLSDEAELK